MVKQSFAWYVKDTSYFQSQRSIKLTLTREMNLNSVAIAYELFSGPRFRET